MARASKAQMMARRHRVFAALVAGQTLTAIAQAEGVHANTITDDVRALSADLATHAAGEYQRTLAMAIASYQRVIDEAWRRYDEAWRLLRAHLAGEFDRTELRPDPDGGMREVRKPPQLRLEMTAYLGKVLEATRALTKLAGVECGTVTEHRAEATVRRAPDLRVFSDEELAQLEQLAQRFAPACASGPAPRLLRTP